MNRAARVMYGTAAAVLLVTLAVFAYKQLNDDVERVVPAAKTRQGEITVAQSIASRAGKRLIVRGYLFDGGGFDTRLCNGRRPGEDDKPPSCIGPFVYLERLDLARLALINGRDQDGDSVAWTEDSIALLGTIAGTTLTVEEILS